MFKFKILISCWILKFKVNGGLSKVATLLTYDYETVSLSSVKGREIMNF